MKLSQKFPKRLISVFGSAIGLLAVGLSAGSLPSAAQGQPSQSQGTLQQDAGQSTPDVPAQNAPPASQVVPPMITLPAGTMIPVRLTEWLSSGKNQSGDRFSGTLEQPLVANGWVVAVRGQVVTGRVAIAKKAPRGGGVSELGVELSELTLVDGQVLPVRTELLQSSAGTSNGRNAAVVATTTAAGAVIGGAAEGGEGAAVGAVIGAAAGVSGPEELHPEALAELYVSLATHTAPIMEPAALPSANGRTTSERDARCVRSSVLLASDGDAASCISA
jgi:hypothetical protein